MWATILSFMLPIISKSKQFFIRNKFAVISSAIIFILGLTVFFQFKSLQKKKKELAVAAHNLAAANDTLRITKDKAGKPETDKLSFLVEKISDLEKANKDLAKEVKETKGQVSQLSKIGFTIHQDKPVDLITKSDITDSTIITQFNYDTTYQPGNFRTLAGFTKHNLKTGISSGTLTKDEIGVKLVTGIKNLDKGKPEIFVRSDYPGFQVTELEGAVLDKNLFGKDATRAPLITPTITLGWVPLTYNWSTKKFNGSLTQVGVSAGVSINILRLFKK